MPRSIDCALFQNSEKYAYVGEVRSMAESQNRLPSTMFVRISAKGVNENTTSVIIKKVWLKHDK
jgi:hypothetical protein